MKWKGNEEGAVVFERCLWLELVECGDGLRMELERMGLDNLGGDGNVVRRGVWPCMVMVVV